MPGSGARRAYTVVGCGAIGGSLAHYLASRGHPVTVVDTDPEHVAAIAAGGITMLTPEGGTSAVPATHACPPDGVPESASHRVLLATKSQHVAAAATSLASWLGPDGFAVLCQNGDTHAAAAAALGEDRVVSAFVNFSADVTAPGAVRVGGPGAVAVGEYDGRRSARVAETVTDLEGFGVVTATENVRGFLWAKRGFAAMLAATALVDAPIADVIHANRDLMAGLASEVYAVASRLGVELESFDAVDGRRLTSALPRERAAAFDELETWLRAHAKPRSGIFRDIAVRHRRSEASFEIAALLECAGGVGVETPALGRLATTLTELEERRRGFGVENLADVRPAKESGHR